MDAKFCPKCGSSQIKTNQQFDIGMATAGTILFGPAGGVAGLAGKTQLVCLSCGHKF